MSLKPEGKTVINCVESKAFQTLLHQAAKNKSFDMIDILLSCDLDVHSKNEDDQTILHLLALGDPSETPESLSPRKLVKSYSRIITLIVELGIDINSQDSYGYTPLHLACAHQNKAMVTALLQNGADINIEDKEGDPPILDVPRNRAIDCILHQHMKKLMRDNLYVSEPNQIWYLRFNYSNLGYRTIGKAQGSQDKQAQSSLSQMGLVQ